MSDDRMGQVERENAETLHFIETPIRMLMNAIKAVFMVVVLVMLVLVNQVGWIVNLGNRSERARVSRNNELESQLGVGPDADGGQWSAFDVDFRTQPNPTDKRMTPANRFWDNAEPFSWQEHEPDNWRAKAFTTTWIGWGSNPDEGIPYCIAAMHPDRVTPFFDATPRSWSTRGDDALDRKSARMQRDYEIAAMMTASLRSALAHIKLNRPLSEVFDHHGHCDAD